jgi:photosystem II stability/assembly factor-like uncharacterized protein
MLAVWLFGTALLAARCRRRLLLVWTSVCWAALVGYPLTLLALWDQHAPTAAMLAIIVDTPVGLNAVACPSPSTCVAVGASPGGGTILRSTNGGSTWHRQPSGTPDILYGVACPRPSTCFAVGWDGTILRSTDGGGTWHSV